MKYLTFIFILLFPLTSFGAWAGLTSFETTDGSTSPTDGNDLNGTGDGTGWSGNWSGATNFDYDNAVAGIPNGSWVITFAGSADTTITRVLTTALVSGRFSVYYRANNIITDNQGIQLQSGATRGQDLFACSTTAGCGGSTGRALTDNAGWTATDQLSANTWYKLDIDFDCTTDTSDIYKDDTLIKTGATFLTPIVTIDRVVFRNSTGGTGADRVHYWDVIADGDVVIPPDTSTCGGKCGAIINGAVIYN